MASKRLKLVFIIFCITLSEIICTRKKKLVNGLSEIETLEMTWETFIKAFSDQHPKVKPSVKFYENLFQIMESVSKAHAATIRKQKKTIDFEVLQSYLKLAITKKNFVFARKILSKTLLGIFDVKAVKNTSNSNQDKKVLEPGLIYLNTLKRTIGEKAYESFISKEGGVTLIFVIDTTGSMLNDIRAAKTIAKSLVLEERNKDVDYILTSFRDPEVQTSLHFPSRDRQQFVKAIDQLLPYGGGDCREMTMTAINDALNSGASYGSSMFVITDASAKDATEEKIVTAEIAAQSLGININFFIREETCLKDSTVAFKQLSQKTSGQVFELKDDREMLKLSSYVTDSLKKKLLLKSASFRDNLASDTSIAKHPIQVDDLVDSLEFTVTTEHSSNTEGAIVLKDPNSNVVQPTLKLLRSMIYKVNKPASGEWVLHVKGRIGKHDLQVKGSGNDIIEFGYFFLHDSTRGISPVDHPLTNASTIMRIMIGGIQHIRTKTLTVNLLSLNGSLLMSNLNLTPVGKLGNIFEVEFSSSSDKTFKVQLQGLTKSGKPFQRVSKKSAKSKGVLLQVLYARKHFTVHFGARTFLVGAIHSSVDDVYSFSISTTSATVSLTRNSYRVRKNKIGFFGILFKSDNTVKEGQMVSILVTAKGLNNGYTAHAVFNLLITAEDV